MVPISAAATNKKKMKVCFNDQPIICYTYGPKEYDRSYFAIYTSASFSGVFPSTISSALPTSSISPDSSALPVSSVSSNPLFLLQIVHPHKLHHVAPQAIFYMHPPIVVIRQKKRYMPYPMLKIDTSINNGLGSLFPAGNSPNYYYDPVKNSVTNRYTYIVHFSVNYAVNTNNGKAINYPHI